ncbi:restriction endonuclease subunit S [Pseudomonas sp. TUM22785]|uniref:restriction endonuclease subunit S n=1 Tax=Pseudomonas sp. TUM22785 TaxID=3019098 RepID=UPI00230640DE|nr:restriction endonuclease subunit S [Pseudomonas sp. TUM22785]WCD78510.1 restriction endonuclease subunit S [Pseudomonas sp. TUM22785]
MTALLTDNLPLLAGAPNGIKKLRELILELAVRGKLVPQDPNDEPANELLKRIAEEKARLVAEGKIKKQKPLAGIEEEEKPFELPSGWVWRRFGEVFSLEYGDNLPADKRSNTGEYPVYGSNGVVGTHSNCFVDSPCIVVGRKGSAGALNLCLSTGCCVTDVAYYCIPPSAFSLDYAFKLFHTLGLDSLGKGIKPGLNRNEAYELVVAVPPLAEQHRIVAKVDELMALCDRLEARQADAGSAHTQLVQALLDSLTLATDAADFAASWQRLAEHFHTLFATESSIDALKQTLLQLAVMGKLVPQDSNDEPACALVERIQTEKQRYLAESKARKQKNLVSDSRPEPPFEIPDSWEWQTIDDVLHVTGGVTLGRKLGGRKLLSKPYLRVANVQRGRLELEHIKEVEIPEDEVEKYLLQNGDLLITEGGDWDKVGRTAIWRDELPECLHQNHVFRARAVTSDWEPRWAEMYLNSTPAREYFARSSKQTTNLASINMTQLRACAFPLPPFAEQHRIVAKVDQLVALCDLLKTRLTQARQLNEQLASTLVERALAKDDQPARASTDQKAARTLLAAEITHQLHGQRTFGQRKLQKVIYLAEHAARLAAVQGNYLRDAAGPHDRQLMNQVENELCNRQWYKCIDRETFGHAYRPLSQAGEHRQAYDSTWSTAERATIERVVDLMRDWDTDRCEMTVTLYAAWNDFIIEGRPVTDDAIVNEVLHHWNDAKLRFSKNDWLAVLTEMKKNSLLTPSGFGRRTVGGTPTLPGFEYSSTTS